MIAWLFVTAALVGHFALHLAIYNRLNATGLRRRTIKRTEKAFVVTCLVIPIVIAVYGVTCLSDASQLDDISQAIRSLTVDHLVSWPLIIRAYGIICVLSLVFFGIPWLLWRPIFGWEWISAPRQMRVVDVEKELGEPLALTAKCRWEAKIPGNQIFQLAIEEIELPVRGLPIALNGLRIAHLSDVHFTGDISARFTEYAIEQANRWQPDMYALTGDIIDKAACIPWLVPTFSKAQAKYGRFFILGNHDTRVSDPGQIRREMEASGWTDVGSKAIRVSLNDTDVEIIGNEAPWFPKPIVSRRDVKNATESPEDILPRFLFSHSPDQISWARQQGVILMLAGHTHGGQGRLPLAGPLLSPSWHGSRFASGDFWKPPTTLHVSRGLSGVHLLRINCRPELSLLTLRSV